MLGLFMFISWAFVSKVCYINIKLEVFRMSGNLGHMSFYVRDEGKEKIQILGYSSGGYRGKVLGRSYGYKILL